MAEPHSTKAQPSPLALLPFDLLCFILSFLWTDAPSGLSRVNTCNDGTVHVESNSCVHRIRRIEEAVTLVDLSRTCRFFHNVVFGSLPEWLVTFDSDYLGPIMRKAVRHPRVSLRMLRNVIRLYAFTQFVLSKKQHRSVSYSACRTTRQTWQSVLDSRVDKDDDDNNNFLSNHGAALTTHDRTQLVIRCIRMDTVDDLQSMEETALGSQDVACLTYYMRDLPITSTPAHGHAIFKRVFASIIRHDKYRDHGIGVDWITMMRSVCAQILVHSSGSEEEFLHEWELFDLNKMLVLLNENGLGVHPAYVNVFIDGERDFQFANDFTRIHPAYDIHEEGFNIYPKQRIPNEDCWGGKGISLEVFSKHWDKLKLLSWFRPVILYLTVVFNSHVTITDEVAQWIVDHARETTYWRSRWSTHHVKLLQHALRNGFSIHINNVFPHLDSIVDCGPPYDSLFLLYVKARFSARTFFYFLKYETPTPKTLSLFLQVMNLFCAYSRSLSSSSSSSSSLKRKRLHPTIDLTSDSDKKDEDDEQEDDENQDVSYSSTATDRGFAVHYYRIILKLLKWDQVITGCTASESLDMLTSLYSIGMYIDFQELAHGHPDLFLKFCVFVPSVLSDFVVQRGQKHARTLQRRVHAIESHFNDVQRQAFHDLMKQHELLTEKREQEEGHANKINDDNDDFDLHIVQ